ncbi:hypothetical protein PIB30_092308 [Stylosanthes scabra]|uniref:Uncharacterized protein n=1 Tax=Stylosanthes scabra TaxID=79078 RepID=A0ABU6TUC6_9FABA|nr:hypothetical protein [Stylosanthes scabra]
MKKAPSGHHRRQPPSIANIPSRSRSIPSLSPSARALCRPDLLQSDPSTRQPVPLLLINQQVSAITIVRRHCQHKATADPSFLFISLEVPQISLCFNQNRSRTDPIFGPSSSLVRRHHSVLLQSGFHRHHPSPLGRRHRRPSSTSANSHRRFLLLVHNTRSHLDLLCLNQNRSTQRLHCSVSQVAGKSFIFWSPYLIRLRGLVVYIFNILFIH